MTKQWNVDVMKLELGIPDYHTTFTSDKLLLWLFNLPRQKHRLKTLVVLITGTAKRNSRPCRWFGRSNVNQDKRYNSNFLFVWFVHIDIYIFDALCNKFHKNVHKYLCKLQQFQQKLYFLTWTVSHGKYMKIRKLSRLV